MFRRLTISRELFTTLSCYALVAGLLIGSVSVARVGGDIAMLFDAPTSRLLVYAAAAALAIGMVGLAVAFIRAGAGGRRTQFWLPTIMATVTAIVMVGLGELVIRILAKPDPLGSRVGSHLLLPYKWNSVVQTNRALLARSPPETAYYVYDPTLGWDIGASRASTDGLYFSSAEGIRSARTGESVPKTDTRLSVAMFGDSFTFSEEVTFADSLGVALEGGLGTESHRVLNFGVPGFGVDQAALKFTRVAGVWKPAVAVFAFIEDDVFRAANTYVFMKADWQLPLSKPRYELSPDGQLTLHNVPTISPEAMFSKRTIFELPRLEREIEFFAPRWRWHPLHESLLMRFLVSRFPVWPRDDRDAKEAKLAELGSVIIEGFAQDAARKGMKPVVVYLPTSGDLNPRGRRVVKRLVIDRLEARGVAVQDLTSCISRQVPEAELFLERGHYSARGNAATAACLLPFVQAAIGTTADTTLAEMSGRSTPIRSPSP